MRIDTDNLILRDYQEEAVCSLLSPPEEVTRSLAVLPTGSGKTIIFAALLDRFLQNGERALVLAHREELLTQARDKIAFAAPSLHVEIEQAASFASRTHPSSSFFENRERSVVVGSMQTLRGKRLKEWEPDSFRIIILDEAHHATGGAYIDILTHFGCLDGRTRLVGVTATPKRTDGIGLGAIFQEIAVEYGIRDMIHGGFLVPIRAWQVQTTVDLRSVKTTAGDYAVGELEEAVNNEKRNCEIVSAYEQYANGMQSVVFCAGVQHSRNVADIFNQRNVPAEPVWGEMGREARAQALASYHRGETRVLTNYGILTEGWDAPQTQCIILARPTKSELLYTQMLGRALRLHPGKDHMVAIDVADVTSGKSLATVAALAGLPPKFNPNGGDVYDMADGLGEIDPRLHRLTTDRESLDKVLAKVKSGMSVAEIDLFAIIARDQTLSDFTGFTWLSVGEDRWSIRADKEMTYEIHIDALARYVLTHTESKAVVYISKNKKKAFAFADRFIAEHHREKLYILDASARWRSAPASEKQIDFIAKLSRGTEIPENINKGDASLLIDSLMLAKKSRQAATAS
jgi:superfamily II DNA or RNA helicase